LLYLYNELTAILEIAIGLPSAQELEIHYRAGFLGFRYAVAGASGVEADKPIGYEADQDTVSLRLQQAECAEAGELRVVRMREDGQYGSHKSSPRRCRISSRRSEHLLENP
jgi:hypothetical protein